MNSTQEVNKAVGESNNKMKETMAVVEVEDLVNG